MEIRYGGCVRCATVARQGRAWQCVPSWRSAHRLQLWRGERVDLPALARDQEEHLCARQPAELVRLLRDARLALRESDVPPDLILDVLDLNFPAPVATWPWLLCSRLRRPVLRRLGLSLVVVVLRLCNRFRIDRGRRVVDERVLHWRRRSTWSPWDRECGAPLLQAGSLPPPRSSVGIPWPLTYSRNS